MIDLVWAGGGLASLELIEVPSANGQRALVLVHALPEVADIGLAGAGCLVAGVLVSVGIGGGLGCCLGGCGGTTTEEASDGVADGRADCYTTVCTS